MKVYTFYIIILSELVIGVQRIAVSFSLLSSFFSDYQEKYFLEGGEHGKY